MISVQRAGKLVRCANVVQKYLASVLRNTALFSVNARVVPLELIFLNATQLLMLRILTEDKTITNWEHLRNRMHEICALKVNVAMLKLAAEALKEDFVVFLKHHDKFHFKAQFSDNMEYISDDNTLCKLMLRDAVTCSNEISEKIHGILKGMLSKTVSNEQVLLTFLQTPKMFVVVLLEAIDLREAYILIMKILEMKLLEYILAALTWAHDSGYIPTILREIKESHLCVRSRNFSPLLTDSINKIHRLTSLKSKKLDSKMRGTWKKLLGSKDWAAVFHRHVSNLDPFLTVMPEGKTVFKKG